MTAMTNRSDAPGKSLGFITVGAILAVLSGTSFFFFARSPDHPMVDYLRVVAFLLGLVFLAIGFAVGRIQRVAREADAAPPATVAAPSDASAAKPASPLSPVFTAQTNTDR